MNKIILLLTLAVLTPTAYPQDLHCDKTKTIAECFAVFVPQETQDAAAKASTSQSQSLAQRLLSEANTGVNSVTAPQESTVKGFLSFLSAFIDVPASDSSSSKPLTLDHNFPIHLLGGDEQRLKLQASLAKPDLSDEVTKRLTDATAANVHDRFVASVTYTQKINAKLSVPVSLVYANHASFLGDVDRKLNAHIGIQFKLPTSK
jgi:hypothetical protein